MIEVSEIQGTNAIIFFNGFHITLLWILRLRRVVFLRQSRNATKRILFNQFVRQLGSSTHFRATTADINFPLYINHLISQYTRHYQDVECPHNCKNHVFIFFSSKDKISFNRFVKKEWITPDFQHETAIPKKRARLRIVFSQWFKGFNLINLKTTAWSPFTTM